MAEFRRNGKHNHVAEIRQRMGDTTAFVAPEEMLPKISSEPPKALTGKNERQIFTNIVKAQEGIGFLRVTDETLLVMLSAEIASWFELKKELTRTPYRAKDAEGRKKVKDGWKEWMALGKSITAKLAELGLSPKQREKFLKDRTESMLNVSQLGYDHHNASEE